MNYYAGIGSRRTPKEVLTVMVQIGAQLGKQGWILRSGFADGADLAFAQGSESVEAPSENYIPWRGFNNAPNHPYVIYEHKPEVLAKAQEIAKIAHPNWNACSSGTKSLHTRNVFQILGRNLDEPVKMVICWTPNGSGSGGTGQAIRIAKRLNIPVFDLGAKGAIEALTEFLKPF